MIREEEIPIGEAVKFLESRLRVIDRVSEWSEAMGYTNPKRFSRLFRNHFRKKPKVAMDEQKAEKAIEMLSDGNGMSCYQVAWEIGKQDEHSLYHFIKRMTGYPPSYFSDRKK